MAVEEVDGLARGPVDRRGMLLAQLHQRAQRHARGDQLHAGCDRLQVVRGVERFVAALDWNQESRLDEAHEQRLGHATALGELAECEGLWCRRSSDGCDERLIRRFELTSQE